MTHYTQKILIVEDEESVSRFLERSLTENSYECKIAATGKHAIELAIGFKPDLIILDLGLPDIDGKNVLLEFRKWLTVPVIILTARESDHDKVEALDAGADDYLTKPFNVSELLARIRATLRRTQISQNEEYKNGALTVNLKDHHVKVLNETIKLTVTEFSILKIFIKNEGKVVTHRALLKEIWGPNSIEHTQYIRVYVGQLRKKLRLSQDNAQNDDQNTDELILTEPGIGYRFIRKNESLKL